MPFRALQGKDYIGRAKELEFLERALLHADDAVAGSIFLDGERGMGKTELLKQLFGLLFWKQDRVAPCYHAINPAFLSAPIFARTYFTRFLCQRIAFEKKEQSLLLLENGGLDPIAAVAEERNIAWACELVREFNAIVDDPLSQLRFALHAPHRSALMSGVPLAVCIDDFHQLRNFTLDAQPNPALISLFEEVISSAHAPHVITGTSAVLRDLPFTHKLKRVVLASLDAANAAALVQTKLSTQNAEHTFPPLLMRRLGGNPCYLHHVSMAACRPDKIENERDFWRAYIDEISDGSLYDYWSTAFKSMFTAPGERKLALSLAHKIHRSAQLLSTKQLAAGLSITEERAETLAYRLYLAGIIQGAFGIFRPNDDYVQRDVIDCLYAKEILAKAHHQLVSECWEKLLAEKPGLLRFDLVLPMTKEAELVAAQCVEQVGKNLKLNQDVVGQLQIAVIEACINAQEHSRGIEKKIYVSIVADEQRLEVSVESDGQEFIVLETGEPFTSHGAEKQPGRGWGIKLMKRFVDDVRFEKTTRGTKTVLIKKLEDSLRSSDEENGAAHA